MILLNHWAINWWFYLSYNILFITYIICCIYKWYDYGLDINGEKNYYNEISKENQRKIDVDYTVNFAKLCEGKVKSFNVVSAIGANSKSKNFYNSLKGELEDKLKEMNLGILRIFQPSLLISERADERFLEELFIKISPVFKFLLRGKAKKYSPIETSLLGKEMVRFAVDYKDRGTYTYNDF